MPQMLKHTNSWFVTDTYTYEMQSMTELFLQLYINSKGAF